MHLYLSICVYLFDENERTVSNSVQDDGSGDKPYSCSFEDCPHRFTSKQLLCRHMKKHERAHRCTFEGCNKRFAFRERLVSDIDRDF